VVGTVGESMGGDGGVAWGVVGWGVLHIVTAFLVGLGGSFSGGLLGCNSP